MLVAPAESNRALWLILILDEKVEGQICLSIVGSVAFFVVGEINLQLQYGSVNRENFFNAEVRRGLTLRSAIYLSFSALLCDLLRAPLRSRSSCDQ